MSIKPTTHLEKLRATQENEKLPASDRRRIEEAIERYYQWIKAMSSVHGTRDEMIIEMTRLVNEYKFYIDISLIFDSPDDFLYRQKGQLKLDNSIIEEFLPWLISETILPELGNGFNTGPTNCYSAIYFESTISDYRLGAGIRVRTKDQDFAISRKLYIKASHLPDFQDSAEVNTYIAYIAAEIKTNLDKTMFQEACATARDLRMAVPGSRYFLLCEWLDMTPVSTAPTDIEEVLILRGAKRLGSNVRKDFSTSAKRASLREEYSNYLAQHPFRADVFKRLVDHLSALLNNQEPIEEDVLQNGFF
jgi:hypothetical protein